MVSNKKVSDDKDEMLEAFIGDGKMINSEFLNGLSIREELVHQGKIPVDQICQILRRIKHLLEIYPDKPLADLLSKKLMEWSICKFAD